MIGYLGLLLLLLSPTITLAAPRFPVGQVVDLIDPDCLDVFSEPHPPGAHFADPTDTTTYDTFDEALYYVPHLGAKEQTSGSSDGWCDDKPWSIAGDITVAKKNTTLYLNPLPMGTQNSTVLIESNQNVRVAGVTAFAGGDIALYDETSASSGRRSVIFRPAMTVPLVLRITFSKAGTTKINLAILAPSRR